MGKWKEVKLNELCKIVGGGTPSKQNKNFYNGDIPWASVRDMNSEIINKTEFKITKDAVTNSSTNIIEKGSIIIATRVGLGKVCYAGTDLAINQDLKGILINDNIINSYLFFYFKNIEKFLIDSGTGATVKGVRLNLIRNLKIPLPPLPEQERIVTKLDGLFEKIDQAISLLEENIPHTEALMGSVLDEEFGKLESKSLVLKDISEKIQYGYTGKTKEKGKYYYLRITDIQDGKVDYKKAPFSDIAIDDAPKYILNKGDILFARTGATAGKSYLFNDEKDSIFASYLIRVVVNQKILSSSYLKWFFQSDDYWEQIFGNIVGAAQPNFNGKKLGELIIPVPNLETQSKCVSKFEEYDKVIRKSVETQIQKLNHLKALKSSLLDQAFKGEL